VLNTEIDLTGEPKLLSALVAQRSTSSKHSATRRLPMEEKITELRQLKQQRAELDEKINALTSEVKADMKAFLKKGKQK
jgi:hypothetical protein